MCMCVLVRACIQGFSICKQVGWDGGKCKQAPASHPILWAIIDISISEAVLYCRSQGLYSYSNSGFEFVIDFISCILLMF